MAFIYSLTDTWNDAGVTFTGIGLNVTDSASNAASNLMNLQVGGVSRFSVNKAGQITAIAAATSYLFQTDAATWAWSTSGFGGTPKSAVKANSFQLSGDAAAFFGFTNSSSANGTVDTFLYRDAANTLALRNGTAAQTLRVYNTFTDASNYERISFGWSANVFTIGRESAGTGVARNMQLVGGGSVLGIGPAASAAVDWTFSAGNLLAGTDNTRDIGASGASRPRNLYMASWIRMATTTVASLPAAATAGAGARMFVTDASTPTFGSAVVGGGAVTVPVYSTGSAWNVG